MPIGSLTSASSDDTTGSISKSGLSGILDGEDWRRARAALGTALDPQGNGATVNWDNPDSGAKGSFVAVGRAYPADSRVCRAFLAELEQKGNDRSMQGTACVEKAGEWAVTEMKPWKKT